jgi:hypothetical protein
MRPAVVIESRRDGGDRYDPESDSGSAVGVVEDVFGTLTPASAELGEPTIVDGSVGRGASGWAPVIEWARDIGIGVLGSAAWDGIKRAASRATELQRDLKSKRVQFSVSRGYAALLAVDHVLTAGNATEATLVVDMVDELSALSGYEVTEPNYVGSEPWLVVLADQSQARRFLVVVGADGTVLGNVDWAMGLVERAYVRTPDRDD